MINTEKIQKKYQNFHTLQWLSNTDPEEGENGFQPPGSHPRNSSCYFTLFFKNEQFQAERRRMLRSALCQVLGCENKNNHWWISSSLCNLPVAVLAWPQAFQNVFNVLSTHHEENAIYPVAEMIWSDWNWSCISCYCLSLSCADTVQGPIQQRLYEHLLHRYNAMIRPVTNDSEALAVRLGLSLMQIIDVVRGWSLATQVKRGPSASPNFSQVFT